MEAEVRMGGGGRGKGTGERPQVWCCDMERGMLMWVPAAVGAVDVGCVLCPRLSGGEKGGLAAEGVASRGLA